MNFKNLTKRTRQVPNIRVLIVSTLILIRHEEVSSYLEITWRVYGTYIDVSNYEIFSYFRNKLKSVYSVDISDMSLEEINAKLEELALIYCTKEIDLAIANGYLSELQEHKFSNKWSNKQLAIITELSEIYGEDFRKFVTPVMSNRSIVYLAIIYDCNPELAEQVSEYLMSDDILYQICCGSQLGLNLLDFALNGHSANDLALVIKASQLIGFNLDDMRKGDSNYLDLDKINNFIINY